jgi:hypothetical protein
MLSPMTIERPLSVARGSGRDGSDVVLWLEGALLHRRDGGGDLPPLRVVAGLHSVSACATHVALWGARTIRVLDASTGALLLTRSIEPSYAVERIVAVADGIEIYGMSNTGYPIDRFGERRRVFFDHRSEVLATAWGRTPALSAVGESREPPADAVYAGPEGTVVREGERLVLVAPQRRGARASRPVILAGSDGSDIVACTLGALSGEPVLAGWAFRSWTAWRLRDGARIGGAAEDGRVRAVDFANDAIAVLVEGREPAMRPCVPFATGA